MSNKTNNKCIRCGRFCDPNLTCVCGSYRERPAEKITASDLTPPVFTRKPKTVSQREYLEMQVRILAGLITNTNCVHGGHGSNAKSLIDDLLDKNKFTVEE